MKAPLKDIDYKPFQGFEFKDVAPGEGPEGSRTWWMRGQNFVACYSQAVDGARFVREAQVDEYMLYLPDAAGASITAGSDVGFAPGGSLSIIPPGRSDIEIRGEGQVVFIFSSRAADLVAKCVNAEAYAEPDSLIPPLVAWPDPVGGWKLRIYDLADYPPMGYPSTKPWTPDSGETRFGRYFRTTTLMVHLHQRTAARDQGKTFPHAQPDYEQAALALEGDRAHHVRTPWGPDISKWREDQHVELGSPSFLVFPPGLIHTTTTLSDASRWVDIFSPPRADISSRPGWVRNEADYPMPAPTPEPAGI